MEQIVGIALATLLANVVIGLALTARNRALPALAVVPARRRRSR